MIFLARKKNQKKLQDSGEDADSCLGSINELSKMAMVFCRGCAKEIHETAHTCPQCGAAQQGVTHSHRAGSPWMGITSLVLGILCILAMFDESEWDKDTLLGLCIFASVGLILGIISIVQKKPGNGLAIAGVALAALSILIFIGLSAN